MMAQARRRRPAAGARSSRRPTTAPCRKEQRAEHRGRPEVRRLRCVVATVSLELGIDMGAVDLVIQVEAPPSRRAAGCSASAAPATRWARSARASLFPKHRGDLLHTAVATRADAGRADRGDRASRRTRSTSSRSRPSRRVALEHDRRRGVVRHRAPQRAVRDAPALAPTRRRSTCSRAATRPTSSPSCARASSGTATPAPSPGARARSGSRSPAAAPSPTAACSACSWSAATTGAARGSASSTRRWSTSRGSATSSRSARRAGASRRSPTTACSSRPAFGQPGRRAVLEGRRPRPARRARPRRSGPFIARGLDRRSDDDAPSERCVEAGLDERAADNLLAFLAEQKRGDRARADRPHASWSSASATSSATGGSSCIPRTACRCTRRGRWRSARASASATASTARRWPATTASSLRDPRHRGRAARRRAVRLRARRARADRHRGGRRLGAVRRRGSASAPRARCCCPATTRASARRCGSSGSGPRSCSTWRASTRRFPIILETVREVLQDVYDLPALTALARRASASARIRIVEAETEQPSPFARVAAVRLRRRVHVRGRLARSPSAAPRRCRSTRRCSPSCSAAPSCASCSTRTSSTQTELELQRLAPDRRRAGIEGVADLLRLLGPLIAEEVAARLERRRRRRSQDRATPTDGDAPHGSTCDARRVARADAHAPASRSPAAERWSPRSKTPRRLRDALGVPLPIGVPVAFIEPVDDPLGDLVGRYARTHGPFTAADVAARLGLGAAVVHRRAAPARAATGGSSRASSGPHAAPGSEWCDAEVLRRLRRSRSPRSGARSSPSTQATFAPLPARRGSTSARTAARASTASRP